MKAGPVLLSFILSVGGALGQAPASPAATPKPTPASETLTTTAKEMVADKANFTNVLNQAKSTMDASGKQLSDALNAKLKALQEKLKADKKYSGEMAEIDTLQKQVATFQSTAEQKFQQQTGPIQQKIATDNAVIQGMVPVVRKENGWPDTASFDVETQTWKGTAEKVEPKK